LKEPLQNLSLQTRRFFSGVFLSRLSGLGRDLAMAFAFGDHPSIAAFMVAFRLSNLLRRLLGEGPFQSAFIPYFEGLRLQNQSKAGLFFHQLGSFLTRLLVLITLISETILISLIAFGNFSSGNREILVLTAWLFPAIIFICLYGLNISLLQCCETFFLPNFAPFVCNLVWIISAIYLKNRPPQEAMVTLAQMLVFGFLGQWLITLPQTLKQVPAALKAWLSFRVSSEIKALLKLFSLSALGAGALQINAFLDTLFARSADLRGPAYLWYSIRLEQLALAVFGIACVGTIVPRLSRSIQNLDGGSAQSLFAFGYKRIMTVMIPCTAALWALGGPGLNLLYGRGLFSTEAVSQTTICLWAYSLGLLPAALVMLYSALFYAKKDFWTPTKAALFSVLLNLSLNCFFVFGLKLGSASIAIATSLSSYLNFGLLARQARIAGWKSAFAFFQKILPLIGLSLAALACTFGFNALIFNQNLFKLLGQKNAPFTRSLPEQTAQLSFLSLAFFSALALLVFLFHNQTLKEFFREFFFRKKTFEQN
jgi:putative peptidoglycan lipid II flippase